MRHYYSAFCGSVIGLILGYMLGGLDGLLIVTVLSVLEITLSFDNAVVNAEVLKNWDQVWQRRFIVWGLPVAVFGMRLIFPLAIVACTTGLSPVATFELARAHPSDYAAILTSVHHEISAFGGAFLLMVFFKFFLDTSKEDHWIEWIEKPFVALGRLDNMVAVALTVIVIVAVSYGQSDTLHQMQFLRAGMFGIITHIVASVIGSSIGGEDGEAIGKHVIRQGIGGLMYLELLDASFSFDGVIGAFSLTTDIFEIALGLGIGALYVRDMTVHLVETNTPDEYKYLAHGAYWAIGFLATAMCIGTMYEIPDWVTGLTGAALIAIAFVSSVIDKRRELKTS